MSRARDIANYGDGIDTASITSGTFADARIAQSNVTQHEGSIDALASNPTVTLGTNTTFPDYHVIQVVDHRYTATYSSNNNAETVIGTDPYLEKSITRASTSNKILVFAHVTISVDSQHGFVQLQRKIGSGSYGAVLNGATGGSHPYTSFGYAQAKSTNTANAVSLTGLDAPGGSNTTVTYRVCISANNTSNPIYVNQTTNDYTNNRAASRSVSSLTLMEIQA